MQFGVQVEPQFGYSYENIHEIAGTALNHKFSHLWFSDHFMLDKNATDNVLLDPWLVMATLARDFEDLRLGSLVFCNSYRHPALHAKMGSTLDTLSNGRLEFGIGAGWKRIEYNAYGYEFPDDLTRIKQLAEAVQIIRKLWTEEKPSFTGEYYRIEDAVSYPKPVQKPNPTIWIGTMLAKDRMLELTARYGDGINVAWSFSPKECEDIFARLDGFCTQNNRAPEEVKRSVGLWTRLFEDEESMEKAVIEGAKSRGVSEETYRDRVEGALWGTKSMIIKKLQSYRKIGVTHVILMFPHQKELEYIQNFEDILIKSEL